MMHGRKNIQLQAYIVSFRVFTATEVQLAEYCGKVFDVSEERGFILLWE